MNITDIQLKKDRRQKENQAVKDKIVAYLESIVDQELIQVYKNWGSGVGKSGRPDLEVVFNGQTWYIECKDPQGILSTVQKARIRKFMNIGVPVFVVDSIEMFKKDVWLKMQIK